VEVFDGGFGLGDVMAVIKVGALLNFFFLEHRFFI
jgi:hypothetical protein